MVRERKKGIKDIEKLHELIDSASLPKQKTPSTYDEEKLEVLRKRLSDRALKDRRQVFSSDVMQTKSDSLTPRVVLHKKEEINKKNEKVIQIDLGPRETKKEKEPLVKFVAVQEDPFSKEVIYEIEKVPLFKEEFIVIKSKEKPKKTESDNGFFSSISALKRKEKHLAKSQPTTTKTIFIETSNQDEKKTKEVLPQKAQVRQEKQTISPSFSQQTDDDLPAFEPVEFAAKVTEKRELKPLRGEIRDEEYKKQKNIEENQLKQQAKEKDQDEKRRAKGLHKKLRSEEAETQQKIQEEQKRKEWELKQAIAQAEEKEQEEKRLVKEREEKARQENLELLTQQRQERERKKREEKQARLELKEKKREAKRLAKEHDRKLKLEWLEFRHMQRKNQKSKELEQKKAAAHAREKEREEKRLVKEREEKIRLDQIALLRKEKEEQKQKKIQEKQAKLEAKGEQREAQWLATEQKSKVKMEHMKTEQKQREEEIKKKNAEVKSKQKEEKQRLLKEQTEKSRLEQIEKEKGKEIQKASKIKKEKKEPGATTWESFDEDASRETDKGVSIFTKITKKEPTRDAQKSLLKIKKQEQKQPETEQKEKEREERLEQKKKLKEQKIQKKIEEKQRSKLFSEMRGDKEKLKQKEIEAKLARREAKEKEREAKRLLKEQQKKKELGVALKERQAKEKEKEEQKLKHVAEKKERHRISILGTGKAKDTEVDDERKKAEQQKNTMKLVRIAAEEKELRKTKAFERKMEKERKKKEREERKFKIKEEEKAKKNMDLHMQEKIIKEKLTKQPDRIDPFVAFDSIDQETATLLSNLGYTSVEKLRQATVKDLVKIGLKKKSAQTIIAECQEFVEWEVFDATDHY
jgi:hypothetical protein